MTLFKYGKQTLYHKQYKNKQFTARIAQTKRKVTFHCCLSLQEEAKEGEDKKRKTFL